MLKKARMVKLVVVSAVLLAGASWLWAAHSDDFGCDGCHVPHNAEALPGVPLWNGSDTTVTFTMSPTLISSRPLRFSILFKTLNP